jgi:2,3-diketo-5-methylthio-1-phosphopentane phosphatase
MTKAATIIMADFDGTVASSDVGYNFFRHFSGGKNNELLPFWKSGEMTTRECLKREAELVRVNREEIFPFLDSFVLDPGFGDFVTICSAHDIPLIIASDGLDFYINYLLEKFGYAHLPAISNRAVFNDNRIEIEFPYDNRACHSCGSCKAERIEDIKTEHGNGSRVVFIGDGYSDACAAHSADVLFAKKDLKQYCQKQSIAFHEFGDFFDVARKLIEMGFLN